MPVFAIEGVAIEAGALDVEPLESGESEASTEDGTGARFFTAPTDLDPVTSAHVARGAVPVVGQVFDDHGHVPAQSLHAGLQDVGARKEYLVLVRGCCPASFESRAPLIDDKGVARAAHSAFTRLAVFSDARASLLRARIHTGRGHQIRRHLALAGHHVLGDTRYGKARTNRIVARVHGLTRLFLHAWRLDIRHPRGGRLTVTAPPAPELCAALERLCRSPLRVLA